MINVIGFFIVYAWTPLSRSKCYFILATGKWAAIMSNEMDLDNDLEIQSVNDPGALLQGYT